MPAVRATIRCSRPCACTCAMPSKNCGAARRPSPTRSMRWVPGMPAVALPGYTHMQQAMPSSVALWATGLCGGNPRRRRRTRAHAKAHRQEPLGIRGRLRHAESCDQPRGDAAASRIRRHSGTGDGGAAVARQGRGAALVRNHLVGAGPGTSGGGLAALLHSGIRLRELCRTPSPPAPPSCRKSAIPTCSS